MMDDIEERVKEKKYQNWVKSTLGLGQTKKALHEYVEKKFTAYLNCTAQPGPGKNFLSGDEIDCLMKCCCFGPCVKKVAKYGKYRTWSFDSYHNQHDHDQYHHYHHHYRPHHHPTNWCKCAFTKILSLHRKGTSYEKIYWDNSDNTQDLSREWLIAKMFMPQGNKETNKGPADTDPYAMFQLMLNCYLFFNCIREAHLKTLQNSDISMKVYDRLQESLQIQRAGIYYDFDKSLCKKEPDVERLREILEIAVQIAEDMTFVKKHLKDFKNIERYKNEIDELHKQRDTVKTLAQKIPPVLGVIKEGNRQLLADVNLLKTDHTSLVDEVQTSILEELKHVPSNENMAMLRNDANVLSEGLKELKLNVQGIQKLSEGFETMRVELGQWQRALRVEVSQLESEGVIVVIIVAVVMSWLFRILLFIG